MQGELVVCDTQSRHKVILEGPDAAFCCITPIHADQDKLYVASLSVSKYFMIWSASLSHHCVRGLKPRLVRYVCILVWSRRMSVPVRLFIGSSKIPLALYAYRMHMYLCPLLDVTGNQPV